MLFDTLNALSDPTRARILAVLHREELAVGELARAVQLPQSTVSRHLKTLEAAGWVERRSAGTSSHLRFPDALSPLERTLWEAIELQARDVPEFREDQLRLDAVLAARITDSRTYFGRVHASWDSVRRELFGDSFLLPTLLGLVDSRLEVADLGCGTGETVALLASHVQRVIGVDREARMLDVARERTAHQPNAELRQGGLTALPLDDHSVDAVLCMLVLHHVEDTDTALAEIARILRPGGRAVVLDMLQHGRSEYRSTMGHVHLGFDPDDLCARAATQGLHPLRLTRLPVAPEAQGPPLFLTVLRTQST